MYDQLLKLAKEKQLHQDRYWHTLLHYRRWFGREASLATKFFLPKTGA
jgi:hypothetical protein